MTLGNRLLDSLPDDLLKKLAPELESVSLHHAQVIYEDGAPINFAYFPTTCLLSVVVTLENGSSIEASTIGNDGFVGMPILMGGETARDKTIAQIAGNCLRISTKALLKFLEDDRLADCLGASALHAIRVYSQSAACIAYHALERRLARWLLMVQDGMQVAEFHLTQEFLGVMLGVQRPTVSIAVSSLESQKVIEHRRGRIKIMDRHGLEALSCECYFATRK